MYNAQSGYKGVARFQTILVPGNNNLLSDRAKIFSQDLHLHLHQFNKYSNQLFRFLRFVLSAEKPASKSNARKAETVQRTRFNADQKCPRVSTVRWEAYIDQLKMEGSSRVPASDRSVIYSSASLWLHRGWKSPWARAATWAHSSSQKECLCLAWRQTIRNRIKSEDTNPKDRDKQNGN